MRTEIFNLSFQRLKVLEFLYIISYTQACKSPSRHKYQINFSAFYQIYLVL